jgi:hypothetical protein
MFPDPDIVWRPFPSVMDGMKAPPFAFDRGLWRGVLRLIVLECSPGNRAYGVEIDCQIYYAVEEMIYSVASHGDKVGIYDGSVYVKEAEQSKLLQAYADIDPVKRSARHFLFVGADFCYETLGFSAPVIRIFDSVEEAYAWTPGPYATTLRAMHSR